MATLPTADQMLANAVASLNEAYRALGDAADWARSDWSPLGSELTDDQADHRQAIFTAVQAAKNAINTAQRRH